MPGLFEAVETGGGWIDALGCHDRFDAVEATFEFGIGLAQSDLRIDLEVAGETKVLTLQ